jgi:hypothetical protein
MEEGEADDSMYDESELKRCPLGQVQHKVSDQSPDQGTDPRACRQFSKLYVHSESREAIHRFGSDRRKKEHIIG